MDAATLFKLANMSVLPAWALLALAPRWKGTQLVVHSVIFPLLLGGLYAFAVATSFFFTPPVEGGSFSSLEGVQALFTKPMGVLGGWVHYLAFDLFVGAWIVRDAGRRGIHHLFVVPCLFFTLMFGPFGFVLYLLLRFVTGKGGLSLDETA